LGCRPRARRNGKGTDLWKEGDDLAVGGLRGAAEEPPRFDVEIGVFVDDPAVGLEVRFEHWNA
jgi:hypothetical protein